MLLCEGKNMFCIKAPLTTISDCVKTQGGDRGGTVVKTLRYKSESRWFDPSWCHWNFSLT